MAFIASNDRVEIHCKVEKGEFEVIEILRGSDDSAFWLEREIRNAMLEDPEMADHEDGVCVLLSQKKIKTYRPRW